MNIQDCLDKGALAREKLDNELIQKELSESDYDLDKATKAFEDEDYKWCIVKCYYCMFHASKAVLFKLGLREKKHFAISIVLDELYKKGLLESRFVNDFKAAVSSREDADYHYTYSKEIAGYDLKICREFMEEMKRLVNDLKV